jgi:hypothetical protein
MISAGMLSIVFGPNERYRFEPRRGLERKDRFAIFPEKSQFGTRVRFSLVTSETIESGPSADEVNG